MADKIGADIGLLFDWAYPTSSFKPCREIADSIKHAIRARYKQTDWEQVVKPLQDKLRNHQRDALTAYLLQQPELLAWNVTDADGLFEYFLIDVQMDACMETSRIKQAISSVQLFIQRCFLGLEVEHSHIAPEVLDRKRWDWMQRYRVWEANRKVFLYPENWIESNLRDDKSPFFKELDHSWKRLSTCSLKGFNSVSRPMAYRTRAIRSVSWRLMSAPLTLLACTRA